MAICTQSHSHKLRQLHLLLPSISMAGFIIVPSFWKSLFFLASNSKSAAKSNLIQLYKHHITTKYITLACSSSQVHQWESISTAYTFSPKHAPRRSRLPVTPEQPKIKETQTSFINDVVVLPPYCQKIIAELLGTYILVFAGCGSALVDRDRSLTILGIAMVWGLSLMALIYTLGHISGAHFNPAVSIAFAITGKLPLLYLPMYVVSQLLGSTIACLTLKILFNHQSDTLPTLTRYSNPTTDLEAFLWEFIITFVLMFAINGAATDDRSSKELAGVAIGGTLMFNVIIAGPITGASMNPARSIGPAVVANEYKKLWIYVIATLLGAIAASLIYSLLRQPKQQKQDLDIESPKSIYNTVYSQSMV